MGPAIQLKGKKTKQNNDHDFVNFINLVQNVLYRHTAPVFK